jgi:hypothetical protein
VQFGDYAWEDSWAQDSRYNAWMEAVEYEAEERAEVGETKGPLKVVVLEIGAGDRVPTVRGCSESTSTRLAFKGAAVTLVRVSSS